MPLGPNVSETTALLISSYTSLFCLSTDAETIRPLGLGPRFGLACQDEPSTIESTSSEVLSLHENRFGLFPR